MTVLMAVFFGYRAYLNQGRDNSLLTGTPCEPPCWQDIIPGKTTSTEAIELLKKSPFVDQESLDQFGSVDAGGATWWWRVPGKRLQPKISWVHDTVIEIVQGLTVEITIEEILSTYGPPEFVTVDPGGIPENAYWIVRLHYPAQGLSLYSYATSIEDSTTIEVAEYYIPVSADERKSDLADKFQYSEQDFFEWAGYGEIQGLYSKNP